MKKSLAEQHQLDLEAVANAEFDLLDEELAGDVEASIALGLKAKAVFEAHGDCRDHFKFAVARAIRAIHSKDKDKLLPRFLSVGPTVKAGKLQGNKVFRGMSDKAVAATIRLIFSSAINSFQGQLAEMLAIRAVLDLQGRIKCLRGTVLHVGDTVKTKKPGRSEWAKAADLHFLVGTGSGPKARREVRGVVEVKSYLPNEEKIRLQLRRHVSRARRGLKIGAEEFKAGQITMGDGRSKPVLVAVVPDTWPLPREYRFEQQGEKSFLVVKPPEPPEGRDRLERLGEDEWKITLRWSEEALAAAAYGLTFWYMGELGRMICEKRVPKGWSAMTPEQAGRNAVIEKLYYAMLRARTVRESSRAIALYNSYGFGYALGANFVDRHGRRQELFYEDLHEILATGRSRTKALDEKHPAQLCRIRGQ